MSKAIVREAIEPQNGQKATWLKPSNFYNLENHFQKRRGKTRKLS